MSKEYSAANPTVCPFCNTDQEFEESLSHDSTRDGDLEFRWECEECEDIFTTIKQLDISGPEEHTLFWNETDEGEVIEAKIVEGDEDSVGVKMERANRKMIGAVFYEVSDRPWAIERLFDILREQYDLEDVEEGYVSVPWMD